MCESSEALAFSFVCAFTINSHKPTLKKKTTPTHRVLHPLPCLTLGNWASAAAVTGGRVNKFNITKQSHDYDATGAYVDKKSGMTQSKPGGGHFPRFRWLASEKSKRGVRSYTCNATLLILLGSPHITTRTPHGVCVTHRTCRQKRHQSDHRLFSIDWPPAQQVHQALGPRARQRPGAFFSVVFFIYRARSIIADVRPPLLYPHRR